MLKNYLKIAWRNIVRNKTYSLINIIGLSVGIASCLLIFLYIQNELSYNRFNKKSARIYRVVMSSRLSGSAQIPAIAKSKLTDFPEVEKAVRLYQSPQIVLTNQGRAFREENFTYVDASFFDVFTFPFIQGSPSTALSRPNTLVLTQTAAHKYFGDVNPIGRSLSLHGGPAFKITGILKDIPQNSDIHFDLLASYATLKPPRGMDDQGYLYMLLHSPESRATLAPKLKSLTKGSLDEVVQRMGFAFKGMAFKLQPLTDLHLYPALNGAIRPPGDVRYLYIFGVIGFFILAIASINYMNLATARSARRAQEVGMRKVLGAQRMQLMGQFFAEAVLFTGAAYVLALCVAELMLPFFGLLTGKVLTFFDLQNWRFIGASMLFILALGFFSGSYPMLVLSRFTPQKMLKGINALTNNKPRLRQGLVIFQFTVTIVLVIGTLVIWNQLRFIQHKRLGYDAQHVLTIPMAQSLSRRLAAGKLKPDQKRISTIKQELGGVSGVRKVSIAYSTPNGYLTTNVQAGGQSHKVTELPVDYDYIPTMKMKLLAGRNFSKNYASDSTRAIIINETAARLFGLKDKVGKPIELNLGHKNPILIGIVKDFHTASFHQAIAPTVMVIQPAYYNAYILRTEAGSLPGVLNRLKARWNKLAPEYPFRYDFLNNQLKAQYESENRLAHIFGTFSILAIVIACMGLLGLAAFSAERRTKEIGVRKVLGATVTNIVGLLSKEFLSLVLIGFVIAVPIAWYAMHKWLADFAYKISIGPGIFLLAGGLALFIALVTVSWQSIRAALANPVDSLRSE